MAEDAEPTIDPQGANKPKPEETGHNVLETGQAIEPEATHNVSDSAARTGDRMWGTPGVPENKP